MRYLNKRAYARMGGPVLLAVLLAAGVVYWRAGRAMKSAEEAVAFDRDLRFVSRPLATPIDSGVEWVSAPAIFSQAEEFHGHLFVAGPAGLSEFDESGKPLREFRVGRELPSSELLKVARASLADSREQELVVVTLDAGVLAFNGTSFRQLLPELREARTTTAILAVASGHLLIGTEKRGLLVYDGRHLASFHPTLARIHVTELAGTDADLWIGTHERGVAHWHGGTVEWFDEAHGLPDQRVYCIAVEGDRAFVGTSAGIVEFDGGRFARVLAPGAFVRALLVEGDTLLAGTMDDGVLEIPLKQGSRSSRKLNSIGEVAEVGQLFRSTGADSTGTLYAVAPRGVFARSGKGDWKRVLVPADSLLEDRNISALAVDSSNRLWVGYFDRGLDIVEASGKRARHIEDDHVFCVNRILPNAKSSSTAVATANGLVLFDSHADRRQVMGRTEGLIAEHVTDVALYRDGLAVATPAGLTFIDSGGTRSLYAFHGLVNNHVYTVAAKGHHLLAGTLGGASLLEDDNIRASYTTATSGLKHNWITASISIGDEWWLGTYGTGVVHMDSAGRFDPADGASGNLVINPNAMVATERFLAAGSMGHGLYIMNRNSGRWSAVTAGLPSLNVTALAAANGYLYVGTDNGLVRIAEQRLER